MGPCVSAWVLISLWLTGYGYLWPPTLKIIGPLYFLFYKVRDKALKLQEVI